MKEINEDFFNSWTEESAYILGYIWADGTLTEIKGRLHVSISSNDRDILVKINNAMGSEHKITDHKGTSSIGFSKPKMIERLIELGLIERKSKTIQFPIGIPDECLRHFIRGYFDGNGHFTYEKHSGEKRRLVSGFTTGSESFGLSMINVLNQLGLREAPLKYVDRRGSGGRGEYYQWKYFQRDTKKLYALMYDGSSIYMERKKKMYDDNINTQPTTEG
ncbi:LAGLIDADG family homing endonuclease [Bacillus cereus]|uniref:LAGLIDADG family homing endonuclease n=1 Tax=Bacillus cereus TaxID=1396 RepID=UPI003D04CA5C